MKPALFSVLCEIKEKTGEFNDTTLTVNIVITGFFWSNIAIDHQH
jgi:hypothetical protein